MLGLFIIFFPWFVAFGFLGWLVYQRKKYQHRASRVRRLFNG